MKLVFVAVALLLVAVSAAPEAADSDGSDSSVELFAPTVVGTITHTDRPVAGPEFNMQAKIVHGDVARNPYVPGNGEDEHLVGDKDLDEDYSAHSARWHHAHALESEEINSFEDESSSEDDLDLEVESEEVATTETHDTLASLTSLNTRSHHHHHPRPLSPLHRFRAKLKSQRALEPDEESIEEEDEEGQEAIDLVVEAVSANLEAKSVAAELAEDPTNEELQEAAEEAEEIASEARVAAKDASDEAVVANNKLIEENEGDEEALAEIAEHDAAQEKLLGAEVAEKVVEALDESADAVIDGGDDADADDAPLSVAEDVEDEVAALTDDIEEAEEEAEDEIADSIEEVEEEVNDEAEETGTDEEASTEQLSDDEEQTSFKASKVGVTYGITQGGFNGASTSGSGSGSDADADDA